MVITIGREYGSGGHETGRLLAKRLNLEFYDKVRLIEKTKELHCEEEMYSFLNEMPADSLLYSIAMEDTGHKPGSYPFRFLRKLAEQESFVLVGRCGNVALRECPDATSVFLYGRTEARIKRLELTQGMSEHAAQKAIRKTDLDRRRFHEYYGGEEWGLARKYQLCIDSTILGPEATAGLICDYLERAGR